MGSWRFLWWQSMLVLVWTVYNMVGQAAGKAFDPYPFILLNLMFSTQASYATPILLMAANRQTERDRVQAEADHRMVVEIKAELDTVKDELGTVKAELSETKALLIAVAGAVGATVEPATV